MGTEIKILVTIPFFYPHKGGAQRYAEELYVKLRKLNPFFHVDVLCYNTTNSPSTESYRGLMIYRVPCYTLIHGKFVLPKLLPLLRTLKKLMKNKYDIINSHTAFFDTTWWAWIYAKKIGAKSIFTGHAPGHPTHHVKLIGTIGRIVHVTLGRWAVKRYDFYTYANNRSKTFFEGSMGAKPFGKVIHVSVDQSIFKPDVLTLNTNVPLPNTGIYKKEQDIYVTYVGRMIETKGVINLYDAALLVKKSADPLIWNNLTFIFCGPGELNNTLKNRAAIDGISDKIVFTGSLEYGQVAQVMKLTDIFISPSSFSEGLPNTILEAGSCGSVIIATDSGSIADVVKNKETGILIPMQDVKAIETAILWCINNKEECKKLANNMRSLIGDTLIWEKTAAIYAEYLQQILESSKA